MDIQVLILDDNENFLKVLKLILEDHFIIKATTNTNEFMELIKEPSVLVVDLNLDRETGIDVIRSVRQKFTWVHTIYISNMASIASLKTIINEGFGSFFLEKDDKDFSHDLVAKVHQAKDLLRLGITQRAKDAERLTEWDKQLRKTLKALDGS